MVSARTDFSSIQKAIRALRWGLVLLVGPASAGAVTLGQIDTFQDGGVAGWNAPGNNTFVTNVPNAGPAGVGDNALNVQADLRFVDFNIAQWTGDYIAAGVTRISLDIRHANQYPLTMRLGIANGFFGFGGAGDTYVTNAGIVVPSDDAWHRIVFDVLPGDFVPSFKNTSNPPNAAAALANVTHFRILHNPTPTDFSGQAVAGSFLMDNILAEGPAVTENADFDDDGDVDGGDFLAWQRGLGTGTQHAEGDADFDEIVDAADLAIWKAQFGPTPPLAAIPEPATAALFLWAAGLLWPRLRQAEGGI